MGLVTMQSGQPFTPYTSQFDPYRNESFNRLVVAGDPNSNVPAGLAYNPAAFKVPALGTFGNSGRNIVRGDGFRSASLSLFRNITLKDSLRLQLRAEAPTHSTTSITRVRWWINPHSPELSVATAAPRTLQLGAKLSF